MNIVLAIVSRSVSGPLNGSRVLVSGLYWESCSQWFGCVYPGEVKRKAEAGLVP